MLRKTAWRSAVSAAVTSQQDQALNTAIRLLRSYGPTGFLLRDEGEDRQFRVYLGDPHTCTCSVFLREQDLCKHICWVLMQKFRIPRDHEYSFQRGLMDMQIWSLLYGFHKVTLSQRVGIVRRKQMHAEDVCPICQEELLEVKEPVSYCRFGCGNNVHISCMKLWADHQRCLSSDRRVKCPLCRQPFSSMSLLREQVKNAAKLHTSAETTRPDMHLGVVCHSCRVTPVIGECFKCTACSYIYLCEDCWKKGCHSNHPLASRRDRTTEWQLVEDKPGDEPEGATSQPSDNDSISPLAADPIQTNMLSYLRTVVVKSGSQLLDEGQQCRLCLQNFTRQQQVRFLLCQHKFHVDCVDQILKTSNCCPLDGWVMYLPLLPRVSDRRTSPKLAICSSLKCPLIPGVVVREKNVKVTKPK